MTNSRLKKRMLRFIKEKENPVKKTHWSCLQNLSKKQYIIIIDRIPIATNYWQNWNLHSKMKNSSASITLDTLLKICIKQEKIRIFQSSYSFLTSSCTEPNRIQIQGLQWQIPKMKTYW